MTIHVNVSSVLCTPRTEHVQPPVADPECALSLQPFASPFLGVHAAQSSLAAPAFLCPRLCWLPRATLLSQVHSARGAVALMTTLHPGTFDQYLMGMAVWVPQGSALPLPPQAPPSSLVVLSSRHQFTSFNFLPSLSPMLPPLFCSQGSLPNQ